MIKDMVFGHDKKALAHFMKTDPEKPFDGKFSLIVQNNFQPAQQQPSTSAMPNSPDLDAEVGSNQNNMSDGGYAPQDDMTGENAAYWNDDGQDYVHVERF